MVANMNFPFPTRYSLFAACRFALSADATRLTGARPINLLTALLAATSFAMSTPVAIPMPSSM
jgi:hypothetical protein